MLNEIRYYISEADNVYYNLAFEEALLRLCPLNAIIVYLWRNDNCVVVGKNQNVFSQVNLAQAYANGTKVARRKSGGGAVYHDSNNLNFSFIVERNCYDVDKQLQVIIEALKRLGLSAIKSGRNDLTIDGCKFSGNAFINKGDIYLHHGTILIDTNVDKMTQLLNVSNAKLSCNGVKSVSSRVVNLSKLAQIKKGQLEDLILSSAAKVYNLPLAPLDCDSIDKGLVEELTRWYADEKTILGSAIGDLSNRKASGKLSWGCVEIDYKLLDSVITSAQVFTDSLDTEIADNVKQRLIGTNLNDANNAQDDKVKDCIALIKSQLIDRS